MKMTRNLFAALAAAFMFFALGGCSTGTIDSGDVGVVREFSGGIETQTLDTGWYWNTTGSVREYTTRQVDLAFDGENTLHPRMKDNLKAQEFDVHVYYSTKGNAIPGLVTKYTNEDASVSGGIYAAAYEWVQQQAQSAAQSAASQYDSLEANQKRDAIAGAISAELQTRLDAENPGAFHVDNVIVNNVVPDASINASIERNVNTQKELETAKLQQQLNEQVAKNNQAITQSISSQILAQKSLDVLDDCAKNARCTIFVNMSKEGLLSIQPPRE